MKHLYNIDRISSATYVFPNAYVSDNSLRLSLYAKGILNMLMRLSGRCVEKVWPTQIQSPLIMLIFAIWPMAFRTNGRYLSYIYCLNN